MEEVLLFNRAVNDHGLEIEHVINLMALRGFPTFL